MGIEDKKEAISEEADVLKEEKQAQGDPGLNNSENADKTAETTGCNDTENKDRSSSESDFVMVEKEDLSPSKETPESKKESDEEPLLSKVVDPLELQEAAENETTEVKAETPVREQLVNQKETAEILDQKTNIESSEP